MEFWYYIKEGHRWVQVSKEVYECYPGEKEMYPTTWKLHELAQMIPYRGMM